MPKNTIYKSSSYISILSQGTFTAGYFECAEKSDLRVHYRTLNIEANEHNPICDLVFDIDGKVDFFYHGQHHAYEVKQEGEISFTDNGLEFSELQE